MRGLRRFQPRVAIAVYGLLLIFAGAAILAGVLLYSTHEAAATVFIAFATAVGPVSILGLIYQYLLAEETRQGIIAGLSELSENALGGQINDLAMLVRDLRHLRDVGLIAAYAERKGAFDHVLDWIHSEERILYIVGNSLRGTVWPDVGDERVLKAISERVASRSCAARFLLTHPAYIHFREDMEAIKRAEEFQIAQETYDTVGMLKKAGIAADAIRFVNAPPTVFGMMTSRGMLLNAYPLQDQAFTSLTVLMDARVAGNANSVYEHFRQAHFEGVWDGPHVEKLRSFEEQDVQLIFDTDLRDLEASRPRRRIVYHQW